MHAADHRFAKGNEGLHRAKTAVNKLIVQEENRLASTTDTTLQNMIKAFYQRLFQLGKPKMVATIAAKRKLITILNVMIREQESWNENYNQA